MNVESYVQCQVAVSLMPRLNCNVCVPLVERCGGVEGFFRESGEGLEAACREAGVSAGAFDRRRALEEAKAEVEQMGRRGIRVCDVTGGEYPALLRECGDAPMVLYYIGELRMGKEERLLAIVGTRRASARCQERVGSVVEALRGMGHRPVVVSGLAYGIDAAAHRASLREGLRTVAVLGHGLHIVYPAAHRQLAERIVGEGGALVSEYPCTVAVHPGNFLRRNRIVAGMCRATLVAESAVKGGAMATARIALSYNRDVMAFPGRPEDVYSAGCNRLIKENVAALVEDGVDVARVLGYPERREAPRQGVLAFAEEEDEGAAAVVAELRKSGDVHADELARATGLDAGRLAVLLLQLELEGKVAALPGQKYALK